MDQRIKFGIVGGYGATGRAVVPELRKSCDAEILIGGRDLAKSKALAAQYDRRVSAARVDVLDSCTLDDFCGRCSLIINCAGPISVLQDRVAQAAFRNRCHYVDAAGMSLVKERMLSHRQEIANLGLSFIVSAGWMPGISEIVPAYAVARARVAMDAIDSLTLYFGDSGEWSDNALKDGVWFIRQTGFRSPGYFRKGEWVRAKMSQASQKIDLGSPVGPGRFYLFTTPELNEVGRQLDDCDFFTYTYVSGLRTTFSATLMALVPLPESFGVHLLRNVFRRNRLPVDGFVMGRVVGRSRGIRQELIVQLVYRDRRDYWIHGFALATVARMVSEGKGVRAGVHFLADAVEPAAFTEELRHAGIEQTENLRPC